MEALLAIRLEWKLDHGPGDDVIIGNRSAFDLTNASIEIEVATPAGKEHRYKGTLERLGAGQTVAWPDVLFISGKEIASRKPGVECDQGAAQSE